MRFSRLLLGAVIALPLALAGCKINTINTFNASPAQIRVANVVPDAPAIAVSVDGTQAWNGIKFEAVTAYQPFTADVHDFGVRIDGTSADLITTPFNIAGQQNYTLVPFGTVSFPAQLMLPDVVQDTGNGTASVRFVLVAAGQSAVDIYVTAPDVLIDNIDPTISFLGYGSSGGYTSFPEGSYRTRITVAGTKSIVYDSGVYALAAHSVANAIIYTRGSSLLVNVMLLDTAGGTVFADNTLSSLKAMNMSPGMANVDLLVGTVPLLTGLAFGVPSNYTYFPSATQTFAFQASATPGAIIAQTTAPCRCRDRQHRGAAAGIPGSANGEGVPRRQPARAVEFRTGALHQRVAGCAAARRADQRCQGDHRPRVGNRVDLSPAAGRHVHLQFADPVTGTISPTATISVLTSSVYTIYVLGPNSAMTAIFTIDR